SAITRPWGASSKSRHRPGSSTINSGDLESAPPSRGQFAVTSRAKAGSLDRIKTVGRFMFMVASVGGTGRAPPQKEINSSLRILQRRRQRRRLYWSAPYCEERRRPPPASRQAYE